MRVIFPITTGLVVAALKNGFAKSGAAYATGATVQPELPGAKTTRMVTVRDDSGPEDGAQTRRRYGINVWASNPVDAEKLALLAMAILRSIPDGKPVTLTDQFSGPYSVPDDPAFVVNSESLAHYFFSFRLTARGTNF